MEKLSREDTETAKLAAQYRRNFVGHYRRKLADAAAAFADKQDQDSQREVGKKGGGVDVWE